MFFLFVLSICLGCPVKFWSGKIEEASNTQSQQTEEDLAPHNLAVVMDVYSRSGCTPELDTIRQ
jgi:hypothetical protein